MGKSVISFSSGGCFWTLEVHHLPMEITWTTDPAPSQLLTRAFLYFHQCLITLCPSVCPSYLPSLSPMNTWSKMGEDLLNYGHGVIFIFFFINFLETSYVWGCMQFLKVDGKRDIEIDFPQRENSAIYDCKIRKHSKSQTAKVGGPFRVQVTAHGIWNTGLGCLEMSFFLTF